MALIPYYIYVTLTFRLVHDWRICIVEYILSVSLHALVLFLRTNNKFLPLAETGTCWNQVTADNILLHSLKVIYLTTNSSLVQDLSGLLERSGTHEALSTKSGTGNTLEDLSRCCSYGITNLNKLHIATLQC